MIFNLIYEKKPIMDYLSDLKKIQTTLNEIINKLEGVEVPTEKKGKASKKSAETAETEDAKPEKVKKNLPMMTKPITEQLKSVLDDVGVGMTDELKKEFAKQMNSMTKDDFATKKLELHIEDFALSKRPSPQGGSGVQPAPAKEEVTELTYKQLKELKGFKETDVPHVFSTKKGLVTGPAEIPEEDMDEGIFEGADILIGEKTRRVYNSEEEFMGWWGFGKFKEADM